MEERFAERRRRWWREPLLHFLVIGAALYALEAARGGEPSVGSPGPPPIRVTGAFLASARADLEQTGRATPEGMQAAIDAYVTEEALYREAVRMGLDRTDLIVRRRLVQKMEFLIDDLAVAAEPTDAELAQALASNRERYRRPARVSFEHVYFSRERRGDALAADAAAALLDARRGAPAAGDAFLPGRAFRGQTLDAVGRRFGAEFAEALAASATRTGAWRGPVESAFGLHLVRIEAFEPARPATLDEARAALQRDLRAERREAAAAAARREIRARYPVRIEEETPATPAVASR